MGYSVSADFRPRTQHPATFWWSLLFEALRHHGMSYDDLRRLPEHIGRYLATDEASDFDDHQAPFRALWERLSDATSDFHDVVTVWTPAFPEWEVHAAVGDVEDDEYPNAPTLLHCWTHDLAPDDSLAVAEDRLALLVAVACEVAELCGPGTGEMTYERYGVVHRFGAIGQPLVLAWWASPTQRGLFDA
jgi:hypothetical protein